MKNVVTLVLGGGQGTRLYPLTKFRSKPAVPVAGKYRLIDIPLSNCINSGLNRIYVLTQFNSVSLHRHIRTHLHLRPLRRRLRRDPGRPADARQRRLVSGHGRRRAAEPPLHRAAGHRLRADPLRRSALPDGLPGDDRHAHQKSGADVTIAAVPVYSQRRRRLGHHAAGRHGPRRRLPGKAARPKQELDLVRTDPGLDRRPRHRRAAAATAWPTWASTCSTATRWSTCCRRPTTATSARRSFRPRSARRHVQVHLFDGYWEDIGTIKSFYEANLELADADAAVRPGLGRGADLLARPVPAADADRRRHGPRQPGRRRLR